MIHLIARDRAARIGESGYLWTASSLDEGRSWSTVKQLPIPNSDTPVDVLQLNDGNFILACNDVHGGLVPLNLKISTDGGDNWAPWLTLEEGSGDYTYPSMVQTENGFIHVVYSHSTFDVQQRSIKHVIIDPSGKVTS